MTDAKPLDIRIDFKEKESTKFSLRGLADGKPYEPEISDLFLRWLRPGDTVIDVGANVGWFTCLAAPLVGPNGSVHAYEPGPANFKVLSENVELNEAKNVSLHRTALSDVSREQKFWLNPHGHGGHSLWKMTEDASALDVRTETLDEQQFHRKIRILKIDTEGHEQRILVGAARLLRSEQAPDFIFAENHMKGLAAVGDTEVSLRRFMKDYDYLCFLLPPHSYLPILLSPSVAVVSPWAVNYLFVKKSQVEEMPQIISIREVRP